MTQRSLTRAVLALAFAISSMVVMALPAAAGAVCSGTCGSWQVDDGSTGRKGANGIYATSSPYELNKITVRPPLMHGNYSFNTKVGWRFKIQRKPVSSGSWNTIYTSSYQTAQADDAIPAYAGHGFSRRSWSAPNNPAGYYYRVLLDLAWWHNGSVEGTVHVRIMWYKAKSGNNSYTNPDYLLASY